MLKNEVTFRIEDSAVQDFVGNGVKTVNGVWRIGEDDVKLFAAKRKKIKDIVAYDGEIVNWNFAACERMKDAFAGAISTV